MHKKIYTAVSVVLAAVFAVLLAGCSDYVMTAEDLAVQKSIEGYWLADASTGYNSYDEEGYPTEFLVVEFTNDFKYFLHVCNIAEGYTMTDQPVSYSFRDEKFMVEVDGVPAYAKVSVSGDGQTMQWITDSQTDTYKRMDEEMARIFGIPEYDSESWANQNSETDNSEGSEE